MDIFQFLFYYFLWKLYLGRFCFFKQNPVIHDYKGDFMIYTDFHMHSSFSGDSDTPMEDMIRGSIARGLKSICFTEHHDPDFPVPDIVFTVDNPAYRSRLLELKEKYKDQIEILYGIEYGFQPHLAEHFSNYIAEWPFDFIIGSSHSIYGLDPYYPDTVEHIDDRKLYRDYFESILYNLQNFDGFQVYGHMDYIVRYGSQRTKHYHVSDYMDLFDEIFRTAIHKGIGIELNTAGLKYGLGFAHPHPDILKRYRELGGEIITIGSDAHAPEHLAYSFDQASDILKSCGFSHYTIFRGRKPEFLPLY